MQTNAAELSDAEVVTTAAASYYVLAAREYIVGDKVPKEVFEDRLSTVIVPNKNLIRSQTELESLVAMANSEKTKGEKVAYWVLVEESVNGDPT